MQDVEDDKSMISKARKAGRRLAQDVQKYRADVACLGIAEVRPVIDDDCARHSCTLFLRPSLYN